MPLEIRSFQPGDQPVVAALIEAGLREHFEPYRAEFNLDLLDIAAHYELFLVGELQGRIVAVGGFQVEDAVTVRIRRMSVAPEHRGQGLAGALLQALLEAARDHGWQRAVLLTGENWQSAISLYERAGFERLGQKVDLGSGFVGLELMRLL